ncbi:hypothetical protein [Pseudoalteromonas piscicida]|uniref:Uncharacterized protein n=1 Tax=Pseudoalteromonas piscicida TaxID=43662 RepID=A0AAD0REW7_PSEO7|nr:hypothetical protein [Pseudoalteromonas piscicida]ASD68142.1 hypothetical protein B1L02_14715 [Pseudoalteromonas piscicida]AXR01152.1 hypothetical protein D0511_03020 [Pseudoalteromonas piscicida]
MSEHALLGWQKRLICNLVSYYKDSQHFHLNYDKGGWHLIKSSSPKLIQIVARNHYIEQVDKLPVTDRKALNSLLKLRKQKHNVECYSTQIRAQDESTSILNSWLFDIKAEGSLVVIPESVLIAIGESNSSITLVNNEYYLAQRNQVIYSVARFGLVNSPERFANTVGISFDTVSEIDSERSLVKRMVESIFPFLKRFVSSFIQPQGLLAYQAYFKKSAVLSAIACVSYLALSSAYLVAKKEYLQAELSGNQSNINQALSTFSEYEKNQGRVENWQAVMQDVPKVSPNLLLLDSVRDKARIESLQYKGDRFVIRGESSNAIAVLESVSEFDWVLDPKFDFPVRSYQGKEEFVISYTIPASTYKAEYQPINERTGGDHG